MNRHKIKDVVASVRSRLLNLARRTGKPFEEILVLYALERFLFRLSQSVHKNEFILKGGLLLVGMGFPQARPTKDIDFLRLIPGSINVVSQAIQKIGNIGVNDGLVYSFSQMSDETMSPDSEYPGVRFKFACHLGRARIPMQIDIGFGDQVVPSPREIEFPTLLDMEPPVIFGYSLETVIAEKFEAALDLADLNSRMKDFYDIWALRQKFSFDGQLLQEAIIATCNRRKTAIQSDANIFSTKFIERSDKNTQWAAFTKKGMTKDAPGDFAKVMTDIRIFLLPVAQASENDEAFQGTWSEGGPWNR
ncbi:MAG: nucleotidyl transferase AbiEii/AbiGii toxin family protein [Desulfobacterales bacterium]|nr:nucleotidyl transferase AbiEii/AbiGii toxin family protein [Desulfobacterales bacterium]